MLALLDAVLAAGEPIAAVPAGDLLLAHSEVVARAAARVVHGLLWGLDPALFPGLDRGARGRWIPQPRLSPSDVARLETLAREWPGVLALASVLRDGHVRERAVAALADVPGPPSVGYLLLRCGDWTPPVRAAAVAALRRHIVPSEARSFCVHAPLLLRREEEGRARGGGIAAEVAALLARPECRGAASEGLRTGATASRRAVQRLLGFAPEACEWLARTTAESADAGSRLLGLLHTVPRLPERARREVLGQALHDPVPRIRSVAIEAWLTVNVDPQERTRILDALLLDPSAAVRAQARWHAGLKESGAAAARYRVELERAAPETLAAAISGLGETGTAADAPRVEPYLAHPCARVAVAALRAWARLDRERAAVHLVSFLASPRPSLGRTARDLLLGIRPTPDVDAIARLSREDPRPNVRRHALALLEVQSSCKAAGALLAATTDADPEVATWALARLEFALRRINWRPTFPTQAELAAVRAALDASRERLPREDVLKWDFALRTMHAR